ncbi:MAG: RNA polymerase sigma factor [Solirubrobacterales bacterium]|nr:RNA polymerase sigma factor [Solirubrobacterales bacterium]
MDRFDRLYSEHAAVVRAYALRRTDHATADDVCAEVWSTTWRKLASVPEDPLPWLFGVARRALANERRAQRRRGALTERLRLLSTDTVALAPAVPGDRRLAQALAELTAADREALLLTSWEDLSPERAAAAMGLRQGTFAVRLHRARQRLARALAAQDQSEVHPSPALERTT